MFAGGVAAAEPKIAGVFLASTGAMGGALLMLASVPFLVIGIVSQPTWRGHTHLRIHPVVLIGLAMVVVGFYLFTFSPPSAAY